MAKKLPRVFIASSGESVDLANAVQMNLDRFSEVYVWTQGVFVPSVTNINNLMVAVGDVDFGVFIIEPIDKTISRKVTQPSPRDNVIYELGLFSGRIGPERCFLLKPRGGEVKLPSDLAGVSILDYRPVPSGQGNSQERRQALGASCNIIAARIDELGLCVDRFPFSMHLPSAAGDTSMRELEGFWLSCFTFKTGPVGAEEEHCQYNIEQLACVGRVDFVGESLSSVSSCQFSYSHCLRVRVTEGQLFGVWANTNTANTGLFQLKIHTRMSVMSGYHLGNSDDGTVTPGMWRWIKLSGIHPDATPSLQGVSIDQLEAAFEDAVRRRTTISYDNLNGVSDDV